jgi:PBP1b-binding outer membrane lipoprotein LpoB
MFETKLHGAVAIILVIALFSGCVDIEKTNTMVNSSPNSEVEITSIADSYVKKLPNSNNENYPQKDPGASYTGVPQTTSTPVQSTDLPYSTPPTPVPTPIDYSPLPITVPTPLPVTNYACNELTNVQKQIQLLQNDRIQKNQLIYKYQSLKSDATQNGDTQLVASYQVQIDELKKLVNNIDIQLSSLKARESILSRECYK